jgi:hypothetical protein
MKKLSHILLLTLALSTVILSSCKKDEAEGPYVSSVSAKIKGVAFSSDSIANEGSANLLTISSVKGKEKIILYMPVDAPEGNHALDFTNYNIMYFDKNGIIYMSKGGYINITKHDIPGKIIEGTFAQTMFNGGPDVAMTDGVFHINY